MPWDLDRLTFREIDTYLQAAAAIAGSR